MKWKIVKRNKGTENDMLEESCIRKELQFLVQERRGIDAFDYGIDAMLVKREGRELLERNIEGTQKEASMPPFMASMPSPQFCFWSQNRREGIDPSLRESIPPA